MKKILLFLLVQLTIEASEITIVADEWCPYNCTPNSAKPGYMVEIVRAAFKEVSPRTVVIYKLMPWTRAMREAREGNISGIIGAIKSEAKGLHTPKIEQGLMSAHFFVPKSSKWEFENLADIKANKYSIGAVSGYDFAEHILKFFKANPNLIKYTHGQKALPQLIKMLKERRIHSVIEDRAVFNFNTRKMPIFKSAGPIGPPSKLYVAFHNQKNASMLSKGMVILRKNGKLKSILDKYGLKDWK